MDPTTCPVCHLPTNGLKGLASHFRHRRNDPLHSTYKPPSPWDGLTAGVDFVHCLVCGHQAETLARHLKASHQITADQYRGQYGDSAKIRGDALTAKRSAAIAARPIVKGETKEVVCPRCGDSWQGSKYLAAGTHDLRCLRCKAQGAEHQQVLEDAQWEGLVEPQDYVSCRVCGHRALNLCSHLQSLHPEVVGSYKAVYPGAEVMVMGSTLRDKAAIRGVPRSEDFKRKVSDGHLALNKSIRLTPEDVAPFRLKNGKVHLALACARLGYCYPTVRRECDRLGVPYNYRGVNQFLFLDLLQVLLGVPYIGEWSSPGFTNPKTGRRFMFDGYFEPRNLLVEFHGYQHYTFPNRFMTLEDEDLYLSLQDRDAEKRRQVLAHGSFKYLEVREDEAWDDPVYLTQRLQALGLTV